MVLDVSALLDKSSTPSLDVSALLPQKEEQILPSLYAPLERKTWTDAFSEVVEKPYSYLPYVNMLDLRDSFRVFGDARAVERGEATPEQRSRLNEFLANQQRGSSWGYKVWNTALRMPAYALEFLTAGGIVKGGAKGVLMAGGSVAAKKSLKEGIEVAAAKATNKLALRVAGKSINPNSVGMKVAQYLAKDSAEEFAKVAAPWIANRLATRGVQATASMKGFAPRIAATTAAQGVAARGAAGKYLGHIAAEAVPRTFLQPHRVANQIVQNMTPQFALTGDEQGELQRILVDEGDDFLPALAKGFGDVYIENLSEQTAEYMLMLKGLFGPSAQQFMKAGMLAGAARHMNELTGKPQAQAVKGFLKDHFLGRAGRGFVERAGWGGVIGELGEEAVGGVLRQATGIEPPHLPSIGDVTAMAVGFAINPLAIGGWAYETGVNEYVQKTADFHTAVETIRNQYKDNPVDFIKDPEQLAGLRGHIQDYMRYHKGREGANVLEKLMRTLVRDRVHKLTGEQLVKQIAGDQKVSDGQMIFDRWLLDQVAEKVDIDDTEALDAVAEQLMGIRILEESEAFEARSQVVDEIPFQFGEEGELTGERGPGKSLAPILYIKRNEAVTQEEFDGLMKRVPWLVDVGDYDAGRVRPFDGGEVSAENLLEDVTEENLRVMATMVGVQRLEAEGQGRRTGGLVIRNQEQFRTAVQARVDRVNEIAKSLPEGWSVGLSPMIAFMDSRDSFSGQPIADIAKPVNEEDPDTIMLTMGAHWRHQDKTLYFSAGHRHTDQAEDVIEMITAPDGQVDGFVQDVAAQIRSALPNAPEVSEASDRELFSKVVKVLRFGHSTIDERDLAYFVTKYALNLNTIDEGLADRIDGYLEWKANQLGIDPAIFDAIKTEGGMFKLGKTYEEPVFSPEEGSYDEVSQFIDESSAEASEELPATTVFEEGAFSNIITDYQDKIHGAKYRDTIRQYLINEFENRDPAITNKKFIMGQLDLHGKRMAPYLKKFFSELYPIRLGGEGTMILRGRKPAEAIETPRSGTRKAEAGQAQGDEGVTKRDTEEEATPSKKAVEAPEGETLPQVPVEGEKGSQTDTGAPISPVVTGEGQNVLENLSDIPVSELLREEGEVFEIPADAPEAARYRINEAMADGLRKDADKIGQKARDRVDRFLERHPGFGLEAYDDITGQEPAFSMDVVNNHEAYEENPLYSMMQADADIGFASENHLENAMLQQVRGIRTMLDEYFSQKDIGYTILFDWANDRKLSAEEEMIFARIISQTPMAHRMSLKHMYQSFVPFHSWYFSVKPDGERYMFAESFHAAREKSKNERVSQFYNYSDVEGRKRPGIRGRSHIINTLEDLKREFIVIGGVKREPFSKSGNKAGGNMNADLLQWVQEYLFRHRGAPAKSGHYYQLLGKLGDKDQQLAIEMPRYTIAQAKSKYSALYKKATPAEKKFMADPASLKTELEWNVALNKHQLNMDLFGDYKAFTEHYKGGSKDQADFVARTSKAHTPGIHYNGKIKFFVFEDNDVLDGEGFYLPSFGRQHAKDLGPLIVNQSRNYFIKAFGVYKNEGGMVQFKPLLQDVTMADRGKKGSYYTEIRRYLEKINEQERAAARSENRDPVPVIAIPTSSLKAGSSGATAIKITKFQKAEDEGLSFDQALELDPSEINEMDGRDFYWTSDFNFQTRGKESASLKQLQSIALLHDQGSVDLAQKFYNRAFEGMMRQHQETHADEVMTHKDPDDPRFDITDMLSYAAEAGLSLDDLLSGPYQNRFRAYYSAWLSDKIKTKAHRHILNAVHPGVPQSEQVSLEVDEDGNIHPAKVDANMDDGLFRHYVVWENEKALDEYLKTATNVVYLKRVFPTLFEMDSNGRVTDKLRRHLLETDAKGRLVTPGDLHIMARVPSSGLAFMILAKLDQRLPAVSAAAAAPDVQTMKGQGGDYDGDFMFFEGLFRYTTGEREGEVILDNKFRGGYLADYNRAQLYMMQALLKMDQETYEFTKRDIEHDIFDEKIIDAAKKADPLKPVNSLEGMKYYHNLNSGSKKALGVAAATAPTMRYMDRLRIGGKDGFRINEKLRWRRSDVVVSRYSKRDLMMRDYIFGNIFINLYVDDAKNNRIFFLNHNEYTVPLFYALAVGNPQIVDETDLLQFVKDTSEWFASPMMKDFVKGMQVADDPSHPFHQKEAFYNQDHVVARLEEKYGEDAVHPLKELLKVSEDLLNLRRFTNMAFESPGNYKAMRSAMKARDLIKADELNYLHMSNFYPQGQAHAIVHRMDRAVDEYWNRIFKNDPKLSSVALDLREHSELPQERLDQAIMNAVMVNALDRGRGRSFAAVQSATVGAIASNADNDFVKLLDPKTGLLKTEHQSQFLPDEATIRHRRAAFDLLPAEVQETLLLNHAMQMIYNRKDPASTSHWNGGILLYVGYEGQILMHQMFKEEAQRWTDGTVDQEPIVKYLNALQKTKLKAKTGPVYEAPVREPTPIEDEMFSLIPAAREFFAELPSDVQDNLRRKWERHTGPDLEVTYDALDDLLARLEIAIDNADDLGDEDELQRLEALGGRITEAQSEIDLSSVRDQVQEVLGEEAFSLDTAEAPEIQRIAQAENREDALRRRRATVIPPDIQDALDAEIDRLFRDPIEEIQEEMPFSLVPVNDMSADIPAYWSTGAHALHGNWMKIRMKMRSEIMKGKLMADQMRRLAGGIKQIGYHYRPMANGYWEVVDLDNPVDGGWQRVQTFQTEDKARDFASEYNKSLPKPTKEQRDQADRVLRAVTAAMEGTDVVLGIQKNPDGSPKRVNGQNVVMTETVANVIASTPGMDQARFNQIVELAEQAMAHRHQINAEMRSIAGPEWLQDLAERIDVLAQKFGRAPGSIKYMPHYYRSQDETKNEYHPKEDTKRGESRELPTYLDAALFRGLLPENLNAAYLVERWFGDVWGAAVNRSMITIGATSRDIDGAPLWLPKFRTEMFREGSKDEIQHSRNAMSDEQVRIMIQNLREYLSAMAPSVNREFVDVSDKGKDPHLASNDLLNANEDLLRALGYVTPFGKGAQFQASVGDWWVKSDMVDGKARTAHHPNINLLKMLERDYLEFKPLGHRNWLAGVERFNNWSKNIGLGLSLFHPVSLAESLIAMGGLTMTNLHRLGHPKKTIKDMNNLRRIAIADPELVGRWVEAGMMVDPTNPNIEMNQIYQDLEYVKEKMPKLAPLANMWQGYNKIVNQYLWSTYFPAIKLYAAETVLTELRENHRARGIEFNESVVMQEIGKMMNDGFGGQNWDQYIWATPQMRQLLHLLFFAPDWCVPKKVRAITKTGYKSCDELEIGDEILGFDPETEEMRWMPLQDMYRRDTFDGELVSIKNYNKSVPMTEDHKCYTVHDRTRFPKVKKAFELNTHDMIPRVGWFQTPEHEHISDYTVRLAGWMVTDGSYAYSGWRVNAAGQRVRSKFGRICQNKLSGIADLEDLGLKSYEESADKGSHDEFVNNRPARRYYVDTKSIRILEDFGIKDNNLTWEFLSLLTHRQLLLLRKTMMLGDGTGQNRFCGKEQEVFNMTLLQTMLGEPSTFYQQEENCWRTRIISSRYITCAGDRKRRVPYKGTIWCPSVETGFWMAEHEGLIFATGNTLSAFNVSGAGNLPGINAMIREKQGPVQKSWQLKRYWPGMVALVMTAMPQAIQLALAAMAKALPGPDDDEFEPFMFNNEPGKRGLLDAGIGGHIDVTPLLKKFGWVPVIGYKGEPTGKRRVYIRFAKQANEVFEGWATRPFTTMMNKTSAGVRTAFEQITGTNTAGWELGFKEEGILGLFSGEDGFTDSRLAYLGRKFMPMSVASILDGRPSTFFAPTSRGMSLYVAQTKMAEILTAYAYDDLHKKLTKKPEWEANLPALGLDILDAAKRNGYDPDKVMAGAKRYVMSKLYSDFFTALNEGKKGQLEKTSRGLMRVNATLKGLQRSMESRFSTAGKDLTPDLQDQISSAFDV